MVNETKADWVEINNSCPFAADMGLKMGAGAVDLTYQFVKACKDILKKPFSVKITPQTNDPLSLAKQVEQAGANAVNMSARLSGTMIDIETAKPEPFGAIGGWGGPYLLGYGLKMVGAAAKELKIPIIAGLGVWDWKDIVRYIMAGATLVQSGGGDHASGVQGQPEVGRSDDAPGWRPRVTESLADIKGLALPNMIKTAEVPRKPTNVGMAIDTTKCTRCGVCLRSCFYDAITLTKVGAVINPKACDVCGMCAEVCPSYAPKLFYK